MRGNYVLKDKGFTLVEVMVAAAISSIIILGVAQSMNYTARASLGISMQQELGQLMNVALPLFTAGCQGTIAAVGGAPLLDFQAAGIPITPQNVPAALGSTWSYPIDTCIPSYSTSSNCTSGIFKTNTIPFSSTYWQVSQVYIEASQILSSSLGLYGVRYYGIKGSLDINFSIQNGTLGPRNWVGRGLGVASTINKTIPFYYTLALVPVANGGTGKLNIVNCAPTTASLRTDSGWDTSQIQWTHTGSPSVGDYCYPASTCGSTIQCANSYFFTGCTTNPSTGIQWNICCVVAH